MMYCPYCFSAIQARMLVCKNPQCQMFDQSMPAKASRLRARLPDALRIRGGVLFADRETTCDACGLPCAAVCESCGREIPAVWARYPSKSVLFLGVNGVGKSTLLATTKYKFSQRSNIVMTPLEVDRTAERFYDQYFSPLLERNENVAHTANEIPQPFLWGVTGHTDRGPNRTMALAAYDVPGEMLNRHADVAPIETLLTRANGVVLVINPASLPGVYERCGQAAQVSPAPDGWEKAERILDEILKHRSIGIQSDVKVAVVFTHLDVWFSALTDCDSARALNDPYLRKLALRWRGGPFLTRLTEFKNARLFATGLYREKEFRPLDGAEAPMLYLMDRMGMRLVRE